jgi:hypothetical protein
MAKTSTEIRDTVKILLGGDSVVGTGKVWETAELDELIIQGQKKLPSRQVKYTLTVATEGKTVDLSSEALEDLLPGLSGFTSPENSVAVEYKVGQTPIQLRNFERFGNTLYIKLSYKMTVGDSLYVYCRKYHVLSPASTLTPDLEDLLERWVEASALMMKSNPRIGQVANNNNEVSNYFQIGAQKLALVKAELAAMTRISSYIEYPES